MGQLTSAGELTLPALSIRQPWAWLILTKRKDVENRTWSTPYRGPLLIHAGKGMDRRDVDYVEGTYGLSVPLNLDRGGIVGIAHVVDVVDRHDSQWFAGPFGWVLCDAQPLAFLPYRGSLGIFRVPLGAFPAGTSALLEQLAQ